MMLGFKWQTGPEFEACILGRGTLPSGLPSFASDLLQVFNFSSGNVFDCAGSCTFWENLSRSVDLSTPIPLQKWDMDAYYSPEASSATIYARSGHHLDGAESFDSSCFELPRSEALLLDPHARLLLESSHVRHA